MSILDFLSGAAPGVHRIADKIDRRRASEEERRLEREERRRERIREEQERQLRDQQLGIVRGTTPSVVPIGDAAIRSGEPLPPPDEIADFPDELFEGVRPGLAGDAEGPAVLGGRRLGLAGREPETPRVQTPFQREFQRGMVAGAIGDTDEDELVLGGKPFAFQDPERAVAVERRKESARQGPLLAELDRIEGDEGVDLPGTVRQEALDAESPLPAMRFIENRARQQAFQELKERFKRQYPGQSLLIEAAGDFNDLARAVPQPRQQTEEEFRVTVEDLVDTGVEESRARVAVKTEDPVAVRQLLTGTGDEGVDDARTRPTFDQARRFIEEQYSQFDTDGNFLGFAISPQDITRLAGEVARTGQLPADAPPRPEVQPSQSAIDLRPDEEKEAERLREAGFVKQPGLEGTLARFLPGGSTGLLAIDEDEEGGAEEPARPGGGGGRPGPTPAQADTLPGGGRSERDRPRRPRRPPAREDEERAGREQPDEGADRDAEDPLADIKAAVERQVRTLPVEEIEAILREQGFSEDEIDEILAPHRGG